MINKQWPLEASAQSCRVLIDIAPTALIVEPKAGANDTSGGWINHQLHRVLTVCLAYSEAALLFG